MLLPHVGMAELQIPGQNLDIDLAAAEDIIPQGGVYSFPAATFVPTIKSSTVNDDSAGTGARTVRVEGLDANWLAITEDVVMNGTTAVALTKTYIRINKAFILTVGTVGTNDGDIDVLEAANIVARIPAAFGQSQQLVFSFPANWTEIRLHGLRLHARSATIASIGVDTKYRDFGLGFKTLESQLFSNTEVDASTEHLIGAELSAKGDLVISATTTVDNMSLSGNLYITARQMPV